MNERLNGVETFVQVVEAGSFALAADRLNLTRSAVGKIIARLETRLGVRLIHRTTRSQSLTEDGQAYYERCVRALTELDAAEAELDGGRRMPRGRLRVSLPLAFGQLCAAPVLMDLVQAHPQLQIDMSFTDRMVDLVDEGFDLAVRIGELRDSASLAARRLGVQHTCICASPAYLARHGTPDTLDDLNGHAGVVYSRAGMLLPWDLRDEEGRVKRVDIRARVSLDDVQAIASAAVAGFGLARIPSWLLARYLKTGELVLVRGQCSLPPQEINVVWPQTRYMPSKTRCAIDALVAGIPALIDA
ncbi:LysR family transcriptional regulator [Caballeronia ptereochthonis]|uniref:LysR family transcriptional regulator n=1 Tax=Caballeronia ptereochthonis TaxID=1777144 RepID=A0A158A5Z9_9BURK|nr:LysR family transcriptional regulator [Caballeronia ptereochthonis]SAK53203.1 LysR family transcriptional regulator [Caballeronia ptereochthonis]